MRTILSTGLRLAFVATIAGLAGACGSVGSFDPGNLLANAAGTQATGPAPIAEADIDCPEIEVQDGTAGYRVGGQTNESVRYQFDILNTARECHVVGNQFNVKVGVAGHLLIGPAGTPGAYSAPLRIVVRRDVDQKPEVSKLYKIEADTTGSSQAPYRFVSEPITLPFTHQQADQDYTILVGFDNGHAAALPKPHQGRHRKPAKSAD